MRRWRRAAWDAGRTRAQRAWAASKAQRRTRCAGAASPTGPGQECARALSFCLPPSHSTRFRLGICFARALFPSNLDVRVRRALLWHPPPRPSRYLDQLSFTGPARSNTV
jgi:hypothetical protein